MALLLADEMVQRDAGRLGDLARFDDSLESIQRSLSLVASLASKLANAARTHGSETRQSIAEIDVDAGPVTLTSWGSFTDNGGVTLSNLGVVGTQMVNFAETDDAAV